MKLELKHLVPYLPYQLIFLAEYNTGFHKEELRFLDSISFDNVFIWGVKFKPILRPLSDLNTNNHVKFTKNYYICFDDFEGFMVKRVNENYTRFNEFYYLFENHFDIFGLIDKGLAVSIHDVEQVIA